MPSIGERQISQSRSRWAKRQWLGTFVACRIANDHEETGIQQKYLPVLADQTSHYDDDGYVIQWARNEMPSNSLAALYGIASDCGNRRVLGEDVDISIAIADETNTRIRTAKIVRQIKRAGKGLVALVGVQSNQFPRAMDIARPLRAAGIPVSIGGLHAAGCLAMRPEAPPEIRDAWALGIAIFAGEAEGQLDALLLDAYHCRIKPLYDHAPSLPGLEGAPTPLLPPRQSAAT